MTEEKTEEVQETEVAPQVDADASESTIDNLDDARKEIQKLRREAANKRVKNKELEEKASNWQKHLDSQKTEMEKLIDRANAAEGEAKKAQRETAVAKMIVKYQIPEEFQEFLVGENEEELKAKAEKLASLKPKGTGKPDFFAGQRGEAVKTQPKDYNDWFKEWYKDVDSFSTKSITVK